MRTRSRFQLWLSALVVSASLTGCSNQGEGERCDLGNGNLDCQSGLLCRQITSASYSLCCPPTDQTPSAAACSNVATPATVDASPIGNTEAGDSSSADASSEGSPAEGADGGAGDDAESDDSGEGAVAP